MRQKSGPGLPKAATLALSDGGTLTWIISGLPAYRGCCPATAGVGSLLPQTHKLGRPQNRVQHPTISVRCCPMSYHELSVEERSDIQVSLLRGMSQRAIARMLNRSPSTISREIRRNRECPRRVHYPARPTSHALASMALPAPAKGWCPATKCSSWSPTCCDSAFLPSRLPASCEP